MHTLDDTPSPYELGGTLAVRPFHVYVPSFGDWGFVMASARPLDWSRARVEVPTRFLDAAALEQLRTFPPDSAEIDADVNTLETHRLVGYYERGWARWYQ